MKTAIILSFLFVTLIVQNVEGANSSISLSKTIHPELNSPFKLGISDDAMIENGPQIIILDIEDSRCPSDVTCVWAGEAKVSVDIIKDNQDLGKFTLTSRAGAKDLSTQTIGGYSIQIVGVDPYPVSTKEISPSDYVVTLIVSDNTTLPPLKQFKSGMALNEIKCKPPLQLVIKLQSGSPACVKESSLTRLTAQGWIINGKSTITMTEGQRDGPLLVQEIFPDHVTGLNFIEYPLARQDGLPVSLKIGDSASNGCTITLTLEKIQDKTATFSKVTNFSIICPL